MNRFALGAAMGTPAASIKLIATGCAGIRIPTAGNPAVTMSGMLGDFGSTSVNGPGQKRLASSSASYGHSFTISRAIAMEETCTIRGLVDGRPFTSKIL